MKGRKENDGDKIEMKEEEDTGGKGIYLFRIQITEKQGAGGTYEGQSQKAGTVIRQVWRIGKRRFAGDWERKIWLCERLVKTAMELGKEIWG